MRTITIVEGTVPSELSKEFERNFKEAKNEALPTGLLSTALLKDTKSNDYRIETTWQSKEAIEEMRRVTGTPKAIELFNKVGANPKLAVFEQVDTIP